MSHDPINAVHRHLLVSQLAGWAPTALGRSRRATFVQAYDGPDGGTADAAVRALAGTLDVPRGARLAVVVLAADPDGPVDSAGPGSLAARLGAAEVGLSADIAVHLIPGGVARLPVALKAAGAAGAPVLTVVDVTTGTLPRAEIRAAATAGRPADVLLVHRSSGRTAPDAAAELRAAGLPLVTEVELVVEDAPGALVCFGTGSEKSLAVFKNAMWSLPPSTGVRYRDATGRLLDGAGVPDREPLRQALLAELRRTGPATVNDLRRYALTGTVYRTADTLDALADLIAAGAVTRDPVHGRLGGEVVLHPTGPTAG